MKIFDVIENISEVGIIDDNVILHDVLNKKVINFNKNKSIVINIFRYYRKKYIYDILPSQILVYNSKFALLKKVIIEEVNQNNSSLVLFEEDLYIVLISKKLDKKSINEIVISNEKEGSLTKSVFCGKILNEKYSLHFNYEERYKPLYLRCSDLLDTKTYWEYSCDVGESIRSKFIIYDNKLIFRVEKKIDLYESEFFIVILDITNGIHIAKIKTLFVAASFNQETGKFVAIQGSNANHQIIKHYEIIDVNSFMVDVGDLNYHGDLYNVGIAVDFLSDKNKLYFVDNIYDYNDQTFTTPKVGCFDVETKTIDFIEEIPDAKGLRLDQILYNENKIYVRSSDNKLFILEE